MFVGYMVNLRSFLLSTSFTNIASTLKNLLSLLLPSARLKVLLVFFAVFVLLIFVMSCNNFISRQISSVVVSSMDFSDIQLFRQLTVLRQRLGQGFAAINAHLF